MIDFNAYQKIVEDSRQSMSRMIHIQDELLSKLANEHPQTFEEITKDIDVLKTSKDLSVVNQIMMKYANRSTK